MDLRHLQIFIQVYQEKSITKAAKKLLMAQPAVSLAIKELESHYQVSLFDRMNRRIYPTAAANSFYQYAIHIIDLFNEMEAVTLNDNKFLKIGSSITNSHYVLPNVLKNIKQKYPDFSMEIRVNNSKILEELVLENQLDIAIIETNPLSNQLIKIPFMEDYLTVIVSNHHPLLQQTKPSLESLTAYPFFTREPGSSVATLVKSVFQSHQIEMKYAMESISTQVIIKNVAYGLGIACLPYMLVKEQLELGLVKKIEVPELNLKRQYHIIYHQHKNISKIIQTFIDECLQFR